MKKITAVVMMLSMMAGALPAMAATYDETFYITPIYEIDKSDPSSHVAAVNDMKTRLGTGGAYAKTGFMAVCRYMNETQGIGSDFAFDPTLVRNIFTVAEQSGIPIVITLNGGPWGDVAVGENPGVNLLDYLEQDPKNCQWRDDNIVPGDADAAYPPAGLGRIITFNNYNSTVKNYRKRNFQAAIAEIKAFADRSPDLFLGITTDPEIFHSPFYWTDYNPDTIREFRDWLQRKYGPISAFNLKFKMRLYSYEQIDPPRPIFGHSIGGNAFGEEWTAFKIALIDVAAEEEARWAAEMGLPASKIYTHQTVRYDNKTWTKYMLSSMPEGAAVAHGSAGITTLQDLCFDESLFRDIRNVSPNWGIFEYNPAKPSGTSYQQFLNALETAYRHNAHILAPYMWSQEANETYYNIRGSSFETAIRDFINVKQGIRRVPSSAGGTGSLYGRVVNTKKARIKGTVVRVGSTVVPTNQRGYFRINSVSAGVQTAYYDAPGYLSQTQVLRISSTGQTNAPMVIMRTPAKAKTKAASVIKKKAKKRR